jgi:hypothetical protein
MMTKALCIMGGACRMLRIRKSFQSGNLNRRNHLQDLSMNMMIIQNGSNKVHFEDIDRIHLAQNRMNPLTGSCVKSKESSSSTKARASSIPEQI